MRLSSTLSIYVGRQFLVSFLTLFFVFLLLIFLIDTVELLRRSAAKQSIQFSDVISMAIFRLPFMGQETCPFAILFGSMIAFWRLTRSQELIITRAAGISAWQILLPILILSFLLGIIQISFLNPLASTTLSRYKVLEARHLKGNKNLLELSGHGLWLRQANKTGQSVIHADTILQEKNGITLEKVSIFMYLGQDKFQQRVDAEKAMLKTGYWQLYGAWTNKPEKESKFYEKIELSTDLTIEKIQNGFAAPETMSFWALPGFINRLEKAGFSAVRHRLRWHSLLATPFLMCAMILIAATFTLRPSRQGTPTFVIAGGILTGFILYFFSDVVFALGLSDSIPITLAAWSPSGVANLLGISMLLHLEDG